MFNAPIGPKPLIEFRAGKCDVSGNRVTPQKRKGLIQLVQGPDMLVHFIWKDRSSPIPEDDLIIFPEDASLKKLKQVKDGRVFLLQFNTSDKRLFFWSQEPKEDKDEEILTKVNQFLNNPPSPGQEASSPGVGMDQARMMNMFRQSQTRQQAPSPRPAQQQQGSSTQRTAQATPPVQSQELHSILSQLGVPSSAVSNVLGQQQQQGQQRNTPSLTQIINPQEIAPLLNNPSVQEQLLPLLPEGRRTPEELLAVLRSPQFQQALETFGEALQSGQLGELLRQFGVGSGGPSSLEGFLQALQNQRTQQQQQQGEKKPEKKDDSMDTSK